MQTNPPNQEHGTVQASGGFGKLTASMPPGFLILAALNVVLVGLIMWFLDGQLDTRLTILTRIVDRCLTK